MSITRTTTDVAHAPTRVGAPPSGTRLTAALFAVAGALFVVYPVARPYSSETGMAGALAFGSDRWVLAHVSAMVAFGCLAAGCCLLTDRLLTDRLLTDRRVIRVSALLGVGLVLPYYGAEAFGLHAMGRAAIADGAASLAGMADSQRYDPVALIMFGAGLIALAVAGVALARGLWASGIRTGAVLVGTGMVLYLPQFFGSPWLRVAHGLVLGIGLVIVAVQTVRIQTTGTQTTGNGADG